MLAIVRENFPNAEMFSLPVEGGYEICVGLELIDGRTLGHVYFASFLDIESEIYMNDVAHNLTNSLGKFLVKENLPWKKNWLRKANWSVKVH